ncbi:MAG: hypothetical protein AB7I04_04870 [Pseudomonadales bacterium]
MNARQKKSKKPSAANSKQPHDVVFLLDRSLGKHAVADVLLDAGANVERHDDHLPIDAPDEDWIRLVGSKGWLAVTKNKNIRYRTAEISAIKRHNCMVIVVRAKNVTGADIGRILAASLPRLRRYAAAHSPPYIVGIDRSGHLSSYNL